jgi:hypothetical protein
MDASHKGVFTMLVTMLNSLRRVRHSVELTFLPGRALFARLPFLGQAFMQIEDRHPMQSWTVHRECHRGEHLIWIKRLHLIYTPASVMAAMG